MEFYLRRWAQRGSQLSPVQRILGTVPEESEHSKNAQSRGLGLFSCSLSASVARYLKTRVTLNFILYILPLKNSVSLFV
jgi:hypothetical protein